VDLGTLFLLAGTVYSDVPYQKVADVRTKNRRLDLGLMGVHEWLLKRGLRYGPNHELAEWMKAYQAGSDHASNGYANQYSLSAPVKCRAIAPTGTIGIVAETTTGIEPVFCVAMKRRYKVGDTTAYQLVVDPTAKRLIDEGVAPQAIEDAYTLAADVERRVNFQAWMQQYVDHGISSTINLPAFGSAHNNEGTVKRFGDMLVKHLPTLRGITCYPDGARGGQPLTPVDYQDALKLEGEVFYEATDVCDLTRGGSCGA
jgi:ribonucleoside-diphosphate reductase alpha chain